MVFDGSTLSSRLTPTAEVEVRFDGTGSGRATYIDGVSLSEVTEGTNSTIATSGTELYWVGGGAL